MEIASIAALISALAGLLTAVGALVHSQNNRAAIRASSAVPDPVSRRQRLADAAEHEPMQAARRGW